jgi:uracil-DNA glycosylase
LEDIAYVNLVRCRTKKPEDPKKKMPPPNDRIADACRCTHFEPWLDLLKPKCVVFVGLWACRQGGRTCDVRGIPKVAINRSKGLLGKDRDANRVEVVNFVRQHLRSP